MFNTRHDSNRPVGSMMRGRIASSTSVEFVRVTDEATPVAITIQWYVVEYGCGVRVQRGEVTESGTTINVPITPVASLSQAFVTWSKTPAADQAFDDDDPIAGELTSATNLRFRAGAANSAHVIWGRSSSSPTRPRSTCRRAARRSCAWPCRPRRPSPARWT